MEAQAAQALDNLKAVLSAAGMGLEDVVKTTVFLADIRDFAAINTIYANYFTGEDPGPLLRAGGRPAQGRSV